MAVATTKRQQECAVCHNLEIMSHILNTLTPLLSDIEKSALETEFGGCQVQLFAIMLRVN
jgi:hypothetical protein